MRLAGMFQDNYPELTGKYQPNPWISTSGEP
jgi:hypothetical protein